jgi:hypothetical protein
LLRWLAQALSLHKEVYIPNNCHASTLGLHDQYQSGTTISLIWNSFHFFLCSHNHSICFLSFFTRQKQHGVESMETSRTATAEFTRQSHFCNIICFTNFRAARFVKKKKMISSVFVIMLNLGSFSRLSNKTTAEQQTTLIF